MLKFSLRFDAVYETYSRKIEEFHLPPPPPCKYEGYHPITSSTKLWLFQGPGVFPRQLPDAADAAPGGPAADHERAVNPQRPHRQRQVRHPREGLPQVSPGHSHHGSVHWNLLKSSFIKRRFITSYAEMLYLRHDRIEATMKGVHSNLED